jgi:putative tryptophan/tyrosine transport system substrate-binding protein
MQFAQLKRREFITALGCAMAFPLAARAQQPVIGYFSGRSTEAEAPLLVAFRQGLEEENYTVGRNVAVEFRFSEGQDDRLPALVADLVRRQVAVLVATDRPSASVAKAATATIPVVFAVGGDPVEWGLVASLNRPSGNLTGVGIFTIGLGPKRLGLLRELVPSARLIGFFVNPNSAAATLQVKELQAAAQTVGQEILVLNAGTQDEINQAFATCVQRKVGAILYSANLLFQVVRDQLVAQAAHHSIPAMYEWREFVTAGGLVSYNTNRTEAWRQVGVYTGRILKGTEPADLPVVQSTKFELAINLKTAKALGLEIPPTLIAIADEVIE